MTATSPAKVGEVPTVTDPPLPETWAPDAPFSRVRSTTVSASPGNGLTSFAVTATVVPVPRRVKVRSSTVWARGASDDTTRTLIVPCTVKEPERTVTGSTVVAPTVASFGAVSVTVDPFRDAETSPVPAPSSE